MRKSKLIIQLIGMLVIIISFTSCYSDSYIQGYGYTGVSNSQNQVPAGSWVKVDNVYYELTMSAPCYASSYDYRIFGTNSTMGTNPFAMCSTNYSCMVQLWNSAGTPPSNGSYPIPANATKGASITIKENCYYSQSGTVVVTMVDSKVKVEFSDVSFINTCNSSTANGISGVLICP